MNSQVWVDVTERSTCTNLHDEAWHRHLPSTSFPSAKIPHRTGVPTLVLCTAQMSNLLVQGWLAYCARNRQVYKSSRCWNARLSHRTHPHSLVLPDIDILSKLHFGISHLRKKYGCMRVRVGWCMCLFARLHARVSEREREIVYSFIDSLAELHRFQH